MFNLSLANIPFVGSATPIQRAISVLRRFGTNAHIYLPGVGMLSGLTAANYLDSAGTTAGTVDQPVGLVLDAAGSLGVELVTNGDFSGGATGWAGFGAGGWAVTGNAATHTAGTYGLIQFNAPAATALKTYKVTFDCTLTAGDIKCYVGGVASTTFITSGAKEVFVSAGASPSYLIAFEPSTSFSGSIDNISVREVTGIAAIQPTTSAKPILRRGAVNLFLYSNTATNAGWIKAGGVTTPSNDTVNLPNLNEAFYNTYTAAVAAASTWTGAVLLSGTGTIYVLVARSLGGAYEEARVKITLTATPTIYAVTHTLLAAQTAMLAGVTRGADGTATTVTFGGGALFQGTYTAQQIQALGGIPLTTTAPASTALGPQYWQFDGSNDSLSLGGPLFQLSDDWCVSVAVNCTEPTTAWRTAFGQRGVGGGPRIQLYFSSGQVQAYIKDDAGTQVTLLSGVSANGVTQVCTLLKRSGVLYLRINGVTKATQTPSLGAATLTEYSIGALGTLDFMNGSVFAPSVVKGTVSDADLLLLEKLVANMSGVTL